MTRPPGPLTTSRAALRRLWQGLWWVIVNQATQAEHLRRYPVAMHLLIGFLLTALSFSVWPVPAAAQSSSVSLLLMACQHGNMSACTAALPIVGNACQRGQQQACGLHKAIRARRQSVFSAEALSDRALYQRCLSGGISACRRLQDGPQLEGKEEQQLGIPGRGR